jgi:hypothetical protein
MGLTSHLHNHFIVKRFMPLQVLFLARPNFGAIAEELFVLWKLIFFSRLILFFY